MSEMEYAIETRKLTKKYGERVAVNNLDLTVGAGEVFALLGMNGAGKTTTVRMLCGLVKPDGGEALIFGKTPENAKKDINVSPQETAVAPLLTVKENLVLIARVYGADKKDAESRAEEMLDVFDLKERASDRAKKLSGGMQRRLSVAMALISEPKLVFLDEPTLGLDVVSRRELWKYIKSLKGKITVVLTTHYLEEAEALADRIAVIKSGALSAVGTAAELVNNAGCDDFEDAFLKLSGVDYEV